MTRSLAIIQAGVGRIGRAVASIVAEQGSRWREHFDVSVRYYALADSSAFVVEGLEVDPSTALDPKAAGNPFVSLPGVRPLNAGLDLLREAIHTYGVQNVVVVDCASGPSFVDLLLAAREAGAGVVLANKDPLAGPYEHFLRIAGSPRHAGISATVGAGLPALHMLTRVAATGDATIRVAARASGSLGFLCDQLMQGQPFDLAVRAADEAGYTEPDPRTDLSGLDVARKLVIMARMTGRPVDLSQVEVESLVPPGTEDITLFEFWSVLPEHTWFLADRAAQAREAGNVVRYIGEFDSSGSLRTGLRELNPSDPLARGFGPENVFILQTVRYREHPLVIAGPGAGVDVTASAVVADLLRVAGVI